MQGPPLPTLLPHPLWLDQRHDRVVRAAIEFAFVAIAMSLSQGTAAGVALNRIHPVVLEGRIVRLEPLRTSHAAALAQVGLAPELWRLQPRPVASVADMRAYVRRALDEQRRGASLPFAIRHRETAAIIGSSRFMDIAPEHRRLEIGATWLSPAQQRTGANIEAKLLLLEHAFDVLGVRKVVFKTEATNERSRHALIALGAVEEGVFRKHLLTDDGRARDMIYFSILDSEWPGVRRHNEGRLGRRW